MVNSDPAIVYTPPSMLPGGYNPQTGTISPTNTTGQTTVPAATVEANAQAEANCIAAGGLSWDTVNGCVMPPGSDTTTVQPDNTLYAIIAFAALAILLMTIKR